jgi:TatD DNase family protein
MPEQIWIDTHCHLDAAEFDADRHAVIAQAQDAGLRHIVIPAVAVANFATVAELAAATPGAVYALGIHPLYTPQAKDADIAVLRSAIQQALDDPRFVAIGEIGLDFFVPELMTPEARARQEWFYVEQLKLAHEFNLPVLLHVRRSQDALLKQLRLMHAKGWQAAGIAHAFNGSRPQADAFIALGFRLGFGGTLTYERSLQIRRLAAALPQQALVLETDAPDIPPVWLHRARAQDHSRDARNAPHELPRIAESLAALRGWSQTETAAITSNNALTILPRLAALKNHAS